MTTEQNRDAYSYIKAAEQACQRRLDLLADQYRRGVHTAEEYEWLRGETIAEIEQTWNVILNDE